MWNVLETLCGYQKVYDMSVLKRTYAYLEPILNNSARGALLN